MKKFERIAGILALLGITLKFFDIPGNGIITTLALSILSVFYYVFSFALFNNILFLDIFNKAAYKETNAKRIIGSIGLGFALSLITIGALFKLQFWSGGTTQLVTGLATLVLIMAIATMFYFRSKADFYIRIFKRIAIYGSFGLLLYLTPSNTLVDLFYGANPEYAELFKQVLADPENEKLREKLYEKEQEVYGPFVEEEE